MKGSIRQKLERLSARHEELSALLASPRIINDQTQFRELSQEYARLETLVRHFRAYMRAEVEVRAAEAMVTDEDLGIRRLAQDEVQAASARLIALEPELVKLLLPKDPHDDSNIFLEIRAGTGGDNQIAVESGNRGAAVGLVAKFTRSRALAHRLSDLFCEASGALR